MVRRALRRPVLVLLGIALAGGGGTRAIETDQYYAWDRPLRDSTDVLNAKFNLEISRVLDRVNARASWRRRSCHQVRRRLVHHFRLLIFHDLELWTINSSLVDRIPATPEEELEYRSSSYLYHNTGRLDPVRMMPPSPTIEINGVRVGTDKLTHFLSEGWWYYNGYRKASRHGATREQAELRAINRGVLSERTILGRSSSGVFSIADLQANYEGMRFIASLCDGNEPLLVKSERGWEMRRAFDFRDHVTPEWDESWQSSIFSNRRWRRVRPVLRRHCPLLDSPAVRERRERYARRERETPTEARIRQLVDEGKLPDPRQFSIEQVCADGSP